MQHQPNVPEEILEKIAKLYAKAKGTDNENEAAAFMGKVQQLLTEYNLSMDTLEGHKIKERGGVTENTISFKDLADKREGKWVQMLIHNCARFNWCKALFSFHNGTVDIFGREHNINVVHQLIEYLLGAARSIEKKSWSGYDGIQKRGAYRRDFLLACVLRLGERMKENREKETYENNQVTSLIRVNDNAVADYMGNKGIRAGSAKKKFTPKERDGHFDGQRAGNNINLGGQMGSGSQSKQIG